MDIMYCSTAIQYYVAGRSAGFALSMPVSGNLFHHAVEMFLKFLLIDAFTAEQFKQDFRHDLKKKLWREVKKLLNEPSLDRFDELVSGLNDFEELRYPGKSFAGSISIEKPDGPQPFFNSDTKQYHLCVEDIDEFISTILRGKVTPEWLKMLMAGNAADQYKLGNKHLFF